MRCASLRVIGEFAAQRWNRASAMIRLRQSRIRSKTAGPDAPADRAAIATRAAGREALKLLWKELRSLRFDDLTESRTPRAIRNGIRSYPDQLLKPRLGAADPELGSRVRAVACGVLTDRLSKFIRIAEHVAQIVGDLVGFSDRRSQLPPRFRLKASGPSAGHRRADKKGAGFRALVVHQRHGGFAFPSLAGHDFAWRANRSRDNRDQE